MYQWAACCAWSGRQATGFMEMMSGCWGGVEEGRMVGGCEVQQAQHFHPSVLSLIHSISAQSLVLQVQVLSSPPELGYLGRL